jgi:hypothetical protein
MAVAEHEMSIVTGSEGVWGITYFLHLKTLPPSQAMKICATKILHSNAITRVVMQVKKRIWNVKYVRVSFSSSFLFLFFVFIFTCFFLFDIGKGSYASLEGKLECLKYAHENGCPWDSDTCMNAGNFFLL